MIWCSLLVLSAALLCSAVSRRQEPVRFDERPNDVIVELGKKAAFFCRATGNPVPQISWRRNGRDIDIATSTRYIIKHDLHHGLSTLRLEPTRVRDNGTLVTCVATNGDGKAGSVEASASVTVLTKGELSDGFPAVLVSPRLKAVEIHRSTYMVCEYTGEPIPEIRWLRDRLPLDVEQNGRYRIATLGRPEHLYLPNGKRLVRLNGRLLYNLYGGTLMIQNASQSEDEGTYECMLRNKHGVVHSQSAHLYVKVRRVPPHFTRPPKATYPVAPGGSVNLTCIALGHPQPRVYWRRTEIKESASDTEKASLMVAWHMVHNVRENQDWTCSAFSNNGHIQANTQIVVKALPATPTNLRIHNVTAHSVALLWDPVALRRDDSSDPGEADDQKTKSYVVAYRPRYADGQDLIYISDILEPRTVLSALEPYTQYEFRVAAVNAIGRGEMTRPVDAMTAEAKPDGAPRHVSARPINNDRTVVVNWETPERPNGEITDYMVHYTTDSSRPFTEWETTTTSGGHTAQLRDLHPSSTYYIRVQAKNAQGLGPLSEPVTVITQKGVPGQPEALSAVAQDSTHVRFRWKPPLHGHGSITNYIVQYSYSGSVDHNTIQIPAPQTETVISGLKPDTMYAFQVHAESYRGQGAPSRPLKTKTNPSVPETAPHSIAIEAMSATSLRVTWDEPRHPKHMISRYRITWSMVPSSNTKGDQRVFSESSGPSDSSESSANSATVNDTDHRRYNIKGLQPWSVYNVTVAAGNSKGFGPESLAKTHRTDETVPSAPRDLKVDVLNSTAIRVRWLPPDRPNGQLAGYYVHHEPYREGNHRCPVPTDGDANAKVTMTPVGLDENEKIINGLKPSCFYVVRVNAFNRKGDGDHTQSQVINMPGQVPSAPRHLSFKTTSQSNVKPVVVELSWDPPEFTYQLPITSYNITYFAIDSQSSESHPYTKGDQTKLVVNLDPGRLYRFRVSATNEKGSGKIASEEYKAAEQAPDGQPSAIRYTYTTDDQLQLHFDPPEFPLRNGRIVGYEVEYGGNVEQVTADSHTLVGEISFTDVPQTDRKVRVRARTAVGVGPWKTQVIPPPGAVIDPPQNVGVQVIGDGKVVVYWQKVMFVDEDSGGKREASGYTVKYHAVNDDGVEPTIHVGMEDCVYPFRNIFPYEHDKLYCHAGVKNIAAGQTFEFRVAATATGRSPSRFSAPVKLSSLQPSDAIVRDLEETHVETDRVTVKWRYEGVGCRQNRCRDVQFMPYFHGSKRYLDDSDTVKNVDVGPKGTERMKTRELQYTFEGLYANTNYTFYIAVRKEDGEYWPVEIDEKTKMKNPDDVQPPFPLGSPTMPDTEPVRLKLTSNEHGVVQYYFVVVVPEELLEEKKAKEKDPEIIFTNQQEIIPTGTDAPPPNAAYVTAKLSRNELKKYTKDSSPFVIGDGKPYDGFANHKLRGGKTYRTFLRAFVSDQLFKSSKFSAPFIAQSAAALTSSSKVSPANLWVIGPAIAGVITLLIALVLAMLWMKRRNYRDGTGKRPAPTAKVQMADPLESSKLLMNDNYCARMVDGPTVQSTLNQTMLTNGCTTNGRITALPLDPDPYHSQPEIQTGSDTSLELRRMAPPTAMMHHPPVPITELAAHIERLKADDNVLFSAEYESIESGQAFTWEHSNLEINKPKNRYANVIAYDHSRVQLESIEGLPGSDYINANFCDGYRKPKAYISTQGPLLDTFCDFWRMIWEQRTTTVVMLTRLEERTRVKCDQYWPARGTTCYGGIMSVTLAETVELAHYTVRTILLQRIHSSEVREIRHLQYTSWPDHGVPEHPTPFLIFLKRVKAVTPADAGPILVHCSAGVGRTGAFIVVDCMLDRLRFETTVDIYGVVTCLRAQRNYMVQTEDQYIFIHDAVLDAVQSGSTEVPAAKLYTHLQRLISSVGAKTPGGECVSGMEVEFRHLTALAMPYASFSIANMPSNKSKNRLVNILPYDGSRVVLSDCANDYINASWVDGYRRRSAYLATQAPLAHTIEDFWLMLWQRESTIVVMLTQLMEMRREKCVQYWPTNGAQQYGNVVVDPVAEYNMPQYILREFKLTHAMDGQTRTLRHFQYTEWPEQNVPKSAEYFIDFIGQVHKTQEQFGQDGPITVHCSAGVGRTGVFIALSIILDRMRYESVVDVFTTVKLLRLQRPNMIQSEEQYQFCYQAALEYLGSFEHFTVS